MGALLNVCGLQVFSSSQDVSLLHRSCINPHMDADVMSCSFGCDSIPKFAFKDGAYAPRMSQVAVFKLHRSTPSVLQPLVHAIDMPFCLVAVIGNRVQKLIWPLNVANLEGSTHSFGNRTSRCSGGAFFA